MDACMNCPYYEECSLDPDYPCFLDELNDPVWKSKPSQLDW